MRIIQWFHLHLCKVSSSNTTCIIINIEGYHDKDLGVTSVDQCGYQALETSIILTEGIPGMPTCTITRRVTNLTV
jgi:hypothetical protein